MTGFITPEHQKEIDDLMADYNAASKRNDPEAKKQARKEIDDKVTESIDTVHELVGSYLYDRDENGNIVE